MHDPNCPMGKAPWELRRVSCTCTAAGVGGAHRLDCAITKARLAEARLAVTSSHVGPHKTCWWVNANRIYVGGDPTHPSYDPLKVGPVGSREVAERIMIAMVGSPVAYARVWLSYKIDDEPEQDYK